MIYYNQPSLPSEKNINLKTSFIEQEEKIMQRFT